MNEAEIQKRSRKDVNPVGTYNEPRLMPVEIKMPYAEWQKEKLQELLQPHRPNSEQWKPLLDATISDEMLPYKPENEFIYVQHTSARGVPPPDVSKQDITFQDASQLDITPKQALKAASRAQSPLPPIRVPHLSAFEMVVMGMGLVREGVGRNNRVQTRSLQPKTNPQVPPRTY